MNLPYNRTTSGDEPARSEPALAHRKISPGATGQDIDKVDRYARHLELAYKTANPRSVSALWMPSGSIEQGALRGNVIVVSDQRAA